MSDDEDDTMGSSPPPLVPVGRDAGEVMSSSSKFVPLFVLELFEKGEVGPVLLLGLI